jgi:hypothetical protein
MCCVLNDVTVAIRTVQAQGRVYALSFAPTRTSLKSQRRRTLRTRRPAAAATARNSRGVKA